MSSDVSFLNSQVINEEPELFWCLWIHIALPSIIFPPFCFSISIYRYYDKRCFDLANTHQTHDYALLTTQCYWTKVLFTYVTITISVTLFEITRTCKLSAFMSVFVIRFWIYHGICVPCNHETVKRFRIMTKFKSHFSS